jgi:hypothetical protein
MPDLNSYDDLKSLLSENQDVITLEVGKLRDLYGADRLGILVRENISRQLASKGIGHYPPHLPDRQNELVRLYVLGSPVDELIKAVRTVGPTHDTLLRNLVAGNGNRILDRIKELLTEDSK